MTPEAAYQAGDQLGKSIRGPLVMARDTCPRTDLSAAGRPVRPSAIVRAPEVHKTSRAPDHVHRALALRVHLRSLDRPAAPFQGDSPVNPSKVTERAHGFHIDDISAMTSKRWQLHHSEFHHPQAHFDSSGVLSGVASCPISQLTCLNAKRHWWQGLKPWDGCYLRGHASWLGG